MTKKIKRRDFLKHGVNIGITSAVGFSFLSGARKTSRPENTLMTEIAVVEGPDALQNTKKAVELLGGMKTFVPEGARVALLPNSQSRHPGTFTNPEVIRAGIRMCKAAGAGEVSCLSWLPKKFWDGSGLGKVVEEEGALLKLVGMEDDYYKTVPLPNGIALKKAMIMKELYNHDILIDMPVIKDHAGNKFTGTMKNLMGLNSPSCNRTFHKKNWDTDINALEHLDQCIADLNLAIKPRLCLVDATV
ncbi:MAG: DUF362 domain-containing protein, partial [Candidatus Aminicenantes bacterium]|nr:DUF362 domain-containing protein [Candidatus Aminicenantes bacterium]